MIARPRTGWPSRVLQDLADTISEVADHPHVHHFKVGRTNDLDVRHRRYRRDYNPAPDRLVHVYETSSVEHALIVESTLIQTFYHHPKSLNRADHAGGKVSPDYYQYVYVAVWACSR